MSHVVTSTEKYTPDIVSARIQEIVKEALAKHGISAEVPTIKHEHLFEGKCIENIQAEESLYLIGENSFVKEYRAYRARHVFERNKNISAPQKKEDTFEDEINYSGKWECERCQITFNRFSKLKAHENQVHSELPQWMNEDEDLLEDVDVMAPLIAEQIPITPDNIHIPEVKIENLERDGTAEASYLIVLLERVTESEIKKFAGKGKKTGQSNKSGRNISQVCKVKTEVPSFVTINEAGRWPCHLCPRDFSEKCALSSHLTLHTGEKPYACQYCQKRFRAPNGVLLHERNHTGEKPFKCAVCGNNYRQMSHLRSHMRTHTGEKPYKCSTCQKTFTHSCALKTHERIHTGEKPYQCNACSMCFRESCKLSLHRRRVHSDELNFSCELCHEKFKVVEALRLHKKRVHLRVFNHKCTVCGERHFTPGDLVAHMRIHTKEKPFVCTICQRTFRLRMTLNLHMMVHTGEKPHSCDFCGKKFTQLQQLTLHRRIHTDEKPFSSSLCPCKFRSTSALSSHARVHQKETMYHCTQCDQQFSCALGRRQHEKSHEIQPVVCQVCRKGFIGARSLRLHVCSRRQAINTEPETEVDRERESTSVVMETPGEERFLTVTKVEVDERQ